MTFITRLTTIMAGLSVASAVGAAEFTFGAQTIAVDSKLSAGVALRVQDRDPALVGIANGGRAFSTNGDDGNLAWDQGDIVSGAVKLTTGLAWSLGDYGFLVRGSGLYNPVLEDKGFFDPADYNPSTPARAFGQDERLRKEQAVQDHVGFDVDLLDAYVFGRWDMLDRSLSARVGRQVLNWGESAFVQHGLNALMAADVNQLRVPGFEIEEVQTPVGMAVFSLDLVQNAGIEAFYQYEWQKTIIDAAGTFWSTNDFAGIGGTQANLGFGRANENQAASINVDPATWCLGPPDLGGVGTGSPCIPFGSAVPRAPDRTPEDGGQYGARLFFYIPALNDMDLSLYAAQYHSRLPLASGISRSGPISMADDANFIVEYPEDIKIYGVSFNTTLPALDVAVQGEYSQKVDQPLQIEDVELLLAGLGAPSQISPLAGATLGNQYVRGWRRQDVSQVDLSLTKVLGPRLGYDQLSLFVEGAYVYVHEMPTPDVLAYDAPGTYTLNPGTAALNPGTAAGLPVTPYEAYATPESWGYKVAGRLSYNNVFNVLNIEPTVLFQHDVDGITPSPIVNFVENRKQVNFIVSTTYLQSLTFDLGYATYFGAGAQNLVSDRDYIDFAVKYSF